MTFNQWLSRNNEHLIQTTRNITSNHEETMDLYQSVILQLLPKADKLDNIKDKEKLYYFIKVLKVNWTSSNSPYNYQKLKYENNRVEYKDFRDNRNDEEYKEEGPDMEWVENELHEIGWFEHDLFMLYHECKTLVSLHKETKIPINSVGKYIKKIKTQLKERWDEREEM